MEGEVKSHNSDLIIALVLGNDGSGESGRWFPKFRGIGPESVCTYLTELPLEVPEFGIGFSVSRLV
jgi:hypothetical protein